MIHKNRGNRRFTNHVKAERKKEIYTSIYGSAEHIPDGMFIKGKVHCSCPMCAAKTNDKLNKSRGPVSVSVIHIGKHEKVVANGSRLSVTNHRFGKKNYKHSEAKSIVAFRQALADC